MALLSLAAASVMTLLADPFFLHWDGLTRWWCALYLLGERPQAMDYGLAPLPPLIMAASRWLTGTFTAFTFLQAVGFYATICLAVAWLGANRGGPSLQAVGVAAVIIAFPLTLVFPVILTDGPGAFIGLVLTTWSLQRRTAAWPGNFLWPLMGALLLFGFRTNALVLVPVFLLVATFADRPVRARQLGALAIVLAAGLAVFALPRAMPEQGFRPQVLGMGWELVGMVKREPVIAPQLAFMGDVEGALARYTADEMNPIFLRDHPPMPASKVARSPVADEVQSLYITTALGHPLTFLAVKGDLALHTLGVTGTLLPMARGMHGHDEWTRPFGGDSSRAGEHLLNLFYAIGDRAPWLFKRPFVVIALVGLGLMVAWRGVAWRGVARMPSRFAATSRSMPWPSSTTPASCSTLRRWNGGTTPLRFSYFWWSALT